MPYIHYAYEIYSSSNRYDKGITATADERARDIFKSVGGELKELYYTFGRYDMIAVVEAPSDEAMGKAFLMIGRFGTVSIETLKAFPEAEGYEIIKGVP